MDEVPKEIDDFTKHVQNSKQDQIIVEDTFLESIESDLIRTKNPEFEIIDDLFKDIGENKDGIISFLNLNKYIELKDDLEIEEKNFKFTYAEIFNYDFLVSFLSNNAFAQEIITSNKSSVAMAEMWEEGYKKEPINFFIYRYFFMPISCMFAVPAGIFFSNHGFPIIAAFCFALSFNSLMNDSIFMKSMLISILDLLGIYLTMTGLVCYFCIIHQYFIMSSASAFFLITAQQLVLHPNRYAVYNCPPGEEYIIRARKHMFWHFLLYLGISAGLFFIKVFNFI